MSGVPAASSVEVLGVVVVDAFAWAGSVVTGVELDAVAVTPVAILLSVEMVAVTGLAVERGDDVDPVLERRACEQLSPTAD